jgi:hypothetical protein
MGSVGSFVPSSSSPPFTRAVLVALVTLFAAPTPGCSGCSRGEAARGEADDRAVVLAIAAQDQRASKAMHAVDEAAKRGASGAALDAIDNEVRPAIEEGLRLAEAARPSSSWGKETTAALGGILRDRKNELPRYAEAVSNDMPDELLAAMEAQAAIERRAIAAVEAIPGAR